MKRGDLAAVHELPRQTLPNIITGIFKKLNCYFSPIIVFATHRQVFLEDH